jgi:hypothetical protein
VGVFTILCMGSPAPAADSNPGGRHSVSRAIAVPNFTSYRTQERIGVGVGTGESVRAAASTRTNTATQRLNRNGSSGASDTGCSEDAAADPLQPAKADADGSEAECR